MSIRKNKFSEHSFFMTLAQDQAKRVIGNTKKNPAVGCVIIKNNCVVGAGSTGFNGKPHAEHTALNFPKINTNNAELYTTLEPCSHYGETPPCTKLIIKKNVKKVFYSINDPDERSYNKCKNILKSKGIKVKNGLNKSKNNIFYRSYFKFKKKDLPFVTCKIAVSKDFYTINKKKKWITNKYSRGRVHLIRSKHDCIITSSKTIIDDNPKLTCRILGLETGSPARIILDSKLKTPINSQVVRDANKIETIIFYNKINNDKIRILKKKNVLVFRIPLNKEGNLDLQESLIKAKKLGFSRILLESGINLMINFFASNLIDDFKLFISNTKINKNGDGNIKKYLKIILKNKIKDHKNVNLFNEKLISYRIK